MRPNQLSSLSAFDNDELVPVTTTNNACLDDIQIQQQLQMHQQSFSPNHLQTHCNLNSNNINNNNNSQQQIGSQLLGIHIATPPLSSSSSAASITTGVNNKPSYETTSGRDNKQTIIDAATRSNNILPDASSNLSNGSSSMSTISETNQSELNSIDSKSSLLNYQTTSGRGADMDTTGTDYVNLARASCSNNTGAINVKLEMSNDVGNLKSSPSNVERGFKCNICNRDFTQKGNLKTHLMTHSGERPYECQTCGKNFTQKGNLDTHVKIHTETKDHKCQYCDRGFTQRGNLKTHIRSIHTKEKPYACGHCGKSFSQKGNMLTHFRTHDKEARFPCNVCGKTFSQKVSIDVVTPR